MGCQVVVAAVCGVAAPVCRSARPAPARGRPRGMDAPGVHPRRARNRCACSTRGGKLSLCGLAFTCWALGSLAPGLALGLVARLVFCPPAWACTSAGRQADNSRTPSIDRRSIHAAKADFPLPCRLLPPRFSPFPRQPCRAEPPNTRRNSCIDAHVQIPIPASPLSLSEGVGREPNRIHHAKYAVSGFGMCGDYSTKTEIGDVSAAHTFKMPREWNSHEGRSSVALPFSPPC